MRPIRVVRSRRMTLMQMSCCCHGCYVSLREDLRHGLIYGPYATEDEQGNRRFISMHEYAGIADRCVYDGQTLPRGRAKRLLKRIADARNAKANGGVTWQGAARQ